MTTTSHPEEFEAALEHDYADNNGVRIHYAALGSGPLLILIHGFPDHWYSWRHQMPALATNYRVLAVDLRGYNLSDKPTGAQNYAMTTLVEDIRAVIDHVDAPSATVVGHDWGGAIAWTLAMFHPDRVNRLIVLNMPHPAGFTRELAHNPLQQDNSEYARRFQDERAHLSLSADELAGWLPANDAERSRYLEALRRSDITAMLHYYQQNYPPPPYTESTQPWPAVQVPVLMIHGLRDTAILPGGLNDSWERVSAPLTILTLPEAGHFVQHDSAEAVTTAMVSWLHATPPRFADS